MNKELTPVEIIKKNAIELVENSKFCYGREGGQGFVGEADCQCSDENPCQATIDKDHFYSYFEGMDMAEMSKKRKEIIEKRKYLFKDSQWYKDNVVE